MVAEDPTCQKMLAALAPWARITMAAGCRGQCRGNLEDPDGVRIACRRRECRFPDDIASDEVDL